MIKSKARAFVLLFLLGACSLFTPYAPDYSAAYITGESLHDQMPADAIREKLTRKTTMGGGTYELALYPLTRPLISAQVRALSLERGLTPEEEAQLLSSRVVDLVERQSCFYFDYKVLRFEQVATPSEWMVWILTDLPEVGEGEEALQESSGRNYPLQWDQPARAPIQGEEMKVHDRVPAWSNWAIGCTSRPLPLEKGFSAKIKVSYVNWPFSDETRMDWNFQDGQTPRKDGDGTSIAPQGTPSPAATPKKSNYQRYRGY